MVQSEEDEEEVEISKLIRRLLKKQEFKKNLVAELLQDIYFHVEPRLVKMIERY